MSYISNTKISCNFITLSFQHTQLQYFCSKPRSNARGIQLVLLKTNRSVPFCLLGLLPTHDFSCGLGSYTSFSNFFSFTPFQWLRVCRLSGEIKAGERMLVLRAGGCRMKIEFGRPAARSFVTTQSTARHEIFWAMPARHEHEDHAVPRISARRAIWHDPHFGPCLGRYGTKTVHRPLRSPLFYYDS